MPSVTRLADVCTGHPGGPPRPNVSASMDVFVNQRGAHRVGDVWAGHLHAGVQASGSGTVFVNGRPLSRVGDAISCGSLVATGSTDVFAGN